MTIADGDDFAAGMVALAAVTAGGKQIDQITSRAYWTVLEKVPGPIVMKALRLAMDHFDFFPAASDLLRLCDEVDAQRAPGQDFALTPPQPAGYLSVPTDTVHGAAHFDQPEPVYYCRVCSDTGFEYHFAPPGHKPHERWVTRCYCAVASEEGLIPNPVIRERIDRAQQAMNVGKYAPKALTRGRRRYREN
jgi:hypothetical protein